jgi:glucan 1,3-beta-glucosidase
VSFQILFSRSFLKSNTSFGGAAGTNLQGGNCPTGTDPSDANCYSHYLALEITSSASAYIEGLWAWLADHDLDGGDQLTIYGGRGILSQSQGPVWMIGTACKAIDNL